MEGRHRGAPASRELTPRQREVLALMANGLTNFEIATKLDLSLEGAKYHVSEVLARLDVASREEAVDVWRRDRSASARVGRFLSLLTPSGIWRVATAATGGAVLVVLVLAGVARDDSNESDDSRPPLGAVVATIPVAEQPDSIAVGEAAVWVGHHTARRVTRIDPGTNTVVAEIPIESRWIRVTTGFGSLWAVGSETATLYRIDPKTDRVVHTLPLYESDPGGTSNTQLEVTDVAVWVKDDRGTVFRVDPSLNEVVARIRIESESSLADISAHGGYVWVVTGLAELHRIDESDNSAQLSGYSLPEDADGVLIAASEDGLWVTTAESIGRIDPVAGRFVEIARLRRPGKPVVAFGSVWIGAGSQTVVVRIPVSAGPGSPAPAITVDGVVLGLAAGPEGIWVTGVTGNVVSRIDPLQDGPGSSDDYVSTPTPQGPVYN